MLLFFYKTKEDYKSMKTKALSILMAIFLAFSVSTVSMAFAADVSSATTLLTASKKKTVKLSAKKATIYYKGTKTLKLLNNKKKVKWYTSNKKVATVSSKGKVTAKGLGTAKITAKVGSKKYTCKVTVKDRNVGTAIGFVTNGGGYFIKGESVAKVTIRPKKYDCAKAVVSIKDAAGDTVYTKTYKNLKKNTNYSFTWAAKDNKGNDLPANSYKVSVKIGNAVSNSAYLAYKTANDFDGGNGSASNPFEVGSTTQLAKIVKYPSANFKQTEDLDFGFEAAGGFFTEDQPFNGVYDGNSKAITNISSATALFDVVGEKGTVKNVIMKDCVVVAHAKALLIRINYGKVTNCNVNGTISYTSKDYNDGAAIGLIVYRNHGTISSCTASGTMTATNSKNNNDAAFAGGIACFNSGSGKIISCTSHTNVKAQHTYYSNSSDWMAQAGGICANNSGMINGCEVDGIIEGFAGYGAGYYGYQGSIVGDNAGQVLNCSYTGTSDVEMTGNNSGIVA